MKRLLLAATVGFGFVLAGAPAATACAPEHCPGTKIVCRELGCPIACGPYVPELEERLCVL